MTTQNAYYDRFFARGGWKYDLNQQRGLLRRLVMEPAGWRRGEKVIEIGAGMCHQAELLRQAGMDITALEASKSGTAYAAKHYPKLKTVTADASKWEPAPPVDHLYVRGMSFYHYELLGENCKGIDVPAQTERFFGWLKPGGTFVLQIKTDFSGRKDAVHMNRYSDYVELFERFGSVVFATDWEGRNLMHGVPPRTTTGIVIGARKAA